MDEKTLLALTQLANKLGTTAEYLWGVLLKQAPISGGVDLLVMLVLVLLSMRLFRFVNQKTTTPPPDQNNPYPIAAWKDETGVALAWFGVWCFSVLVILHVVCDLNMVVAAFMNPGYWALSQIIH